ncbi:MAG: sugar ABC transporter ATP-binding protein [Shinella sp.]|nr:MAG: sugar ABC transporter ATP-binding protein [Shinella sp.]
MSRVQIRQAGKRYATLEVLKDVSVDIEDGQFVVLVGPSGCGKSTLLRMIAGLEEISSGEIDIGGRVVNDLQPKDRDIAMVFQSYALYPHKTVAENMGFALRLKKVSPEEINAKVARAAEILSLTNLLDRYPRQLSGGQRQRVAMGRAIVRDPQVFLFDEPLSNLDAKLRVQMRAEIKELHHRLKTTTIYVTHDQVEAMTMADKIVVMRDGSIEQVGTPLDLYDRPKNMFVAGFIGSPSMNFIMGTMSTSGFTTSDGIALPTPDQRPGSATAYGIRPEHLRLTDDGIPLEVVVLEPTGSETMVLARLGKQNITCVFRERLSVMTGSIIYVQPDLEAVHLFDQDGFAIR